MVASAIATLGTMFFLWLGSGIQFGFGSLELPVTILSSTFDARYPITDFNAFETQAIGLFIGQCFLATLFLQFIYCRGILLFSALFRSELVNLLVAGFCLLSPYIFQRRWFSAYLDKTFLFWFCRVYDGKRVAFIRRRLASDRNMFLRDDPTQKISFGIGGTIC